MLDQCKSYTYPLLVWKAEDRVFAHLDELEPAIFHPESKVGRHVRPVFVAQVSNDLVSLLAGDGFAAPAAAVVEFLAAVPLEHLPVALRLRRAVVCHLVLGPSAQSRYVTLAHFRNVRRPYSAPYTAHIIGARRTEYYI